MAGSASSTGLLLSEYQVCRTVQTEMRANLKPKSVEQTSTYSVKKTVAPKLSWDSKALAYQGMK